MVTMHLLIVEDSRPLADLLRKGLEEERNVVEVATTGEDGLYRAEGGTYDAVILDLMLPDLDGLEIARRLRTQKNAVPILMLTARDALSDRLRGFEEGADDYLTKPFAFQELLARLRAVTRRGPVLRDDTLTVDELVLDRRSHEVARAGQRLHLTPKEYALLEYLMERPGRVLSRTLILERVWDYAFSSFGNVVDVTVRRLRKVVDEGYEKQLIQTVRGVGYKIQA
jgi:DNA-binding response OmpR family regulator